MFYSYLQNGPLPKYTEIGPDGEILYQSNTVPIYLNTTYLQPHGIVLRNSLDMSDLRTSNYYRTFDIPKRFDRPDWWQDYRKIEPNPFYRTTNQEYGSYKPGIHTMPSVYRNRSNIFTNSMAIGGNYRRHGFDTSTSSLVPKQAPRGTLPISLGPPKQAKYVQRPMMKKITVVRDNDQIR